jgi:hypothetical protein
VATAASKMARRCATSAARCAMNRRMSSVDTLVSHRGGRTCCLPTPKGCLVIGLLHPARSCAKRVRFGEGGRGAVRAGLAEVLEVAPE